VYPLYGVLVGSTSRCIGCSIFESFSVILRQAITPGMKMLKNRKQKISAKIILPRRKNLRNHFFRKNFDLKFLPVDTSLYYFGRKLILDKN
jgi:hypothetical protein